MAILVLGIIAVVPVTVWLVLRHKRSILTLQRGSRLVHKQNKMEGQVMIIFHNSSRDVVLANELAESNNLRQVSFKGCSAYGVIPQTVEEENNDYETIPLRPTLPRFPPPRGSGPTSSLQTTVLFENTQALQDYTTVVSGQASNTGPSHSPPQELGNDDHIYEPTDTHTYTATPTSTPPIALPTGDTVYDVIK